MESVITDLYTACQVVKQHGASVNRVRTCLTGIGSSRRGQRVMAILALKDLRASTVELESFKPTAEDIADALYIFKYRPQFVIENANYGVPEYEYVIKKLESLNEREGFKRFEMDGLTLVDHGNQYNHRDDYESWSDLVTYLKMYGDD